MKTFPAITLSALLQFEKEDEGDNRNEEKKNKINTTKEEKSLLNVQEMTRSKQQSARDVNEK